jgi:Skp family chaperone for outer membrane proteins
MKALVCGLAAAAVMSAHAAAAAPAAPLGGPLVAGVCLFSQDEVIGRSQVGQAASARLLSLKQGIQASLEAEKARLDRKGAALGAQRASIPPAQFQAEAAALEKRGQALQAEAAERQQQFEATRAKVLHLILDQAQPFVAQAYTAHSCGLLVSRDAVLGGNLGNDLTLDVLTAMDAKPQPLTFDLEPPPAQGK